MQKIFSHNEKNPDIPTSWNGGESETQSKRTTERNKNKFYPKSLKMSEEQEQSRRVRTMQDLLRFCVEGTVSEGVQSASIEIDPERKEWLQNAIKAFTIDIIQEMLEAIANIKTKLSQLNRDHYDDDG
jgi:hypothetical protein